MKNAHLSQQVIPFLLTLVILVLLIGALWSEIMVLNLVTLQKILLSIHLQDVIVGLTIYLKTSIDFAIFMGNLMRVNPGWKNRIAIEIGTAIGNALGTLIVLAVWTFFKEINWLLAVMVILASLVLLALAQEGLTHAKEYDLKFAVQFRSLVLFLEKILERINSVFRPVLSRLIPHMSMNTAKANSFWHLFSLSFTIPFILGLDDFAGYVPLFNIVNVFGFAIGVMAGHTILNIFLFLSPKKTITAVKNPLISFFGSIAFVVLAVWGLREGVSLLLGAH
jgi:hypothetical protein